LPSRVVLEEAVERNAMMAERVATAIYASVLSARMESSERREITQNKNAGASSTCSSVVERLQ
jgi:hypothetical protein